MGQEYRSLLFIETYQADENSTYPEHIETLSTGALTRISLPFRPFSQPNSLKLRHSKESGFDVQIISAIFRGEVIIAGSSELA
jgi:hypothetical protein